MNDSENVISIEKTGKNGRSGIIFRASADNQAAREQWVFLVENLQPGFVVELTNGIADLTRPSGHPLPPELYRKVLRLE